MLKLHNYSVLLTHYNTFAMSLILNIQATYVNNSALTYSTCTKTFVMDIIVYPYHSVCLKLEILDHNQLLQLCLNVAAPSSMADIASLVISIFFIPIPESV